MLNVVTVSDALSLLAEHFKHEINTAETVALTDALGRVLAQNIYAQENIPGFNRSTVDGYAVIASDTFGCNEALPAMLKNVGEVLMGKDSEISLAPGEAAYIPTGGVLPHKADAVVMIEYCEDLGSGEILIQKSAAPGQHIIFASDDMK
ncbi:MAG: molybdopterin molybdenumtransferase MoeA, partial [Clostridia bacterium]|nr:molybdopterin molybdenumtransferase MoeA [Clostridia bacterium]